MFGPALSEPFVHFELGPLLARLALPPKTPGKLFEQNWDKLRRQLRVLGGSGGPQRVCNHVIVPLAHCLATALRCVRTKLRRAKAWKTAAG
jgi:hypothetical protein